MMPSDEAVEAALKIYNPSIAGAPAEWQQHHHRMMRAALAAAAPFIAAQAWDEGARAMFVDDPFKPTPTNPYRSGT